MKKKRVIKVVLIVILLVVAGFAKIIYDEVKSQERADAIINDVVNKKVEFNDIDYSSLGKYETFVKEYCEAYVKIDSDMNKINAEFDKYSNYNMLDLKYIKDPVDGKIQIEQCIDVVNQSFTLLNEDVTIFEKVIEKAPLSSKEKEGMKGEFKADVSKSTDETRLIVENAQSIKSDIDKLYDFLISIKGKYSVEKNQVIFDTQKDLDKYNEFKKIVLNNMKK